MSTFQEILESISEELTKTDICENKEFYFDLSQVTANTEIPCIVFQESSSEARMWQQSVNMGCINLLIPIEIILILSEKTPSELIAQLWDFREAIIRHLADVAPQTIHPKLDDLQYEGASPVDSIDWRVLTEYNDNKEVMVSLVAVKYLLSYSL